MGCIWPVCRRFIMSTLRNYSVLSVDIMVGEYVRVRVDQALLVLSKTLPGNLLKAVDKCV